MPLITFSSMLMDSKLRRVTIRDVAAEAAVAPSTVSLFIRGRTGVSDETGQRIAAAIEKLGYVPRRKAESRQEKGLFGFVIERMPLPAFSDIFYGEIIRALEAQAKAFGYGMLFSISQADELPRMVTDKQVRGLLILGGSPANDALARHLIQAELPLVLVDNYIPGLPVDCIVPDNRWGGYVALKHLLDLGHRRIAIIHGPPKYRTLVDRADGALWAAREHGLPIQEAYRQPSISSGRPDKGYLEMKQLLSLSEPPTAVFAVSDKTAVGALHAVKEAGLTVPHDVSIVGFDDVTGSDRVLPPLTTMHVPKYEMGVLAMKRLIELVEVEDATKIRAAVYTNLVVRQSTGPPHR